MGLYYCGIQIDIAPLRFIIPEHAHKPDFSVAFLLYILLEATVSPSDKIHCYSGPSDETGKTEVPCRSGCGTIKIPPCSKELSIGINSEAFTGNGDVSI